MRPVLVGVDGTRASVVALRRAFALAVRDDAALDVVLAYPRPIETLSNLLLERMAGAQWQPRVDAEQRLARMLADVFGARIPPQVHATVVEGDPHDELVRRSSGASTLVVGSHRDGPVARVVLGSVGTACAARAHCPVLVVHADD